MPAVHPILIAVCSALLAAGALAAGCGGDDEETTGATGATGATGEQEAIGGGSAEFEEGLRETLENVEFTCDEPIPPADESTVVCEATSQSEEGVELTGDLVLTRIGDEVTFDTELQGEDGSLSVKSGQVNLKGKSTAGSLLE